MKVKIRQGPGRPGQGPRQVAWDALEALIGKLREAHRVGGMPGVEARRALVGFWVFGYGADLDTVDRLTTWLHWTPAGAALPRVLRWRDRFGDPRPPLEVTLGGWTHAAAYDTIDLSSAPISRTLRERVSDWCEAAGWELGYIVHGHSRYRGSSVEEGGES